MDHENVQATALKVVFDLLHLFGLEAFSVQDEEKGEQEEKDSEKDSQDSNEFQNEVLYSHKVYSHMYIVQSHPFHFCSC